MLHHEVVIGLVLFILIYNIVIFPFITLPQSAILYTSWEKSQRDEFRVTLWEARKRFLFFLLYRQRLKIILLGIFYLIIPLIMFYNIFMENMNFIRLVLTIISVMLLFFLFIGMIYGLAYLCRKAGIPTSIPFWIIIIVLPIIFGLLFLFIEELPRELKLFAGLLLLYLFIALFHLILFLASALWALPKQSRHHKVPYAIKVFFVQLIISYILAIATYVIIYLLDNLTSEYYYSRLIFPTIVSVLTFMLFVFSLVKFYFSMHILDSPLEEVPG